MFNIIPFPFDHLNRSGNSSSVLGGSYNDGLQEIIDECSGCVFSIYAGIFCARGIRDAMNRCKGRSYTNSFQGLISMICCGFSLSIGTLGVIYYPNGKMPDMKFRLYTTALFSYFFFIHTDNILLRENLIRKYCQISNELVLLDDLLSKVNMEIDDEEDSSSDKHKLLISKRNILYHRKSEILELKNVLSNYLG